MNIAMWKLLVILRRAWFQWSDGVEGSREKKGEESETVSIGDCSKEFCPQKNTKSWVVVTGVGYVKFLRRKHKYHACVLMEMIQKRNILMEQQTELSIVVPVALNRQEEMGWSHQ